MRVEVSLPSDAREQEAAVTGTALDHPMMDPPTLDHSAMELVPTDPVDQPAAPVAQSTAAGLPAPQTQGAHGEMAPAAANGQADDFPDPAAIGDAFISPGLNGVEASAPSGPGADEPAFGAAAFGEAPFAVATPSEPTWAGSHASGEASSTGAPDAGMSRAAADEAMPTPMGAAEPPPSEMPPIADTGEDPLMDLAMAPLAIAAPPDSHLASGTSATPPAWPEAVPDDHAVSGWPEAAPLALLADFDTVAEEPAAAPHPGEAAGAAPAAAPSDHGPSRTPAATFADLQEVQAALEALVDRASPAPVAALHLDMAPEASEPESDSVPEAAPFEAATPLAAAAAALRQVMEAAGDRAQEGVASEPAAAQPAPPPAPAMTAPAAPAPAQPASEPAASQAPAAAKPAPEEAAAPKPSAPKAERTEGTERAAFSGVDVEAFSRNLARLMEEGGKAMAAYLGPREKGKTDDLADDIADAMKTVGQVVEYWMADPQRTIEAQSRLMGGYLSVWANTLKRLAGEEVPPVAAPDPKDARFKDEGWRESPIFDAIKQAYLVTSHWAQDMVDEAEGLSPHVKHKAEFLVRQIANAISPSNFILTNPELIRETLTSSGENLVKGMQNLTEDLIAGRGTLKIRQTDTSAFEVGRNLATTPGKVIFENELMQLIQYEATTATVKRTPVLVVPPWINKYYILDLTPEKSLIKWLVDQGVTVFTISWVNPDARLAAKGFDDYMRDGIMAALDQVAVASGERRAHAVGYCVGGTLLATTLAYMAATGDDRIASATFLTTQIDFTHAGDLKVFVDEEQLSILERKMKEMGYLEGSKMASAFNMLRSNDLIWPYVVNNYMKGKAPFPFDLLYWNSDSTRMPAANHSYYLRNCYLTNNIARGFAELSGLRIDMHKVQVPVYSLATREDHIAPPNSVFIGANLLSGPVRYVLAGSGHIAGVVNPPTKMKYQYWADGPVGPSFDAWLEGAREHKGSWWPDWLNWFSANHPGDVEARAMGGGRLDPIEDAPGRYVKERS